VDTLLAHSYTNNNGLRLIINFGLNVPSEARDILVTHPMSDICDRCCFISLAKSNRDKKHTHTTHALSPKR
jgi:hypothetical protein